MQNALHSGRILASQKPFQDHQIPSKPIRFENEKDHVKANEKYYVNQSDYIKKILVLYNKHLYRNQECKYLERKHVMICKYLETNQDVTTPSQHSLILKAPIFEVNETKRIPELSQDPSHVSEISSYNLFYEETDKLRQKPKLVDGAHGNYRPRP